MTYQDALQFLDSFVNYEKNTSYNYKESLKLDRMQSLLALVKNPQKDLKVLHIAGTKGKGSTASTLYSILKEAGFRTGLYTSPHLITFNERIKVSDINIKDDIIAELVEMLKPHCLDLRSKNNAPSFFEIYTALSFLHFKREKTDFVVLETGLGGRLDATNVAASLVSGITQISFEHTDKLGNTLGEIAFEKAGIIKEGSVTVSSGQEGEAMSAIESVAKEKRNRFFAVGRDITFNKIRHSLDFQEFDLKGILKEYKNLRSPLLGDHQLENIATAVGMAEALKFYGIMIDDSAVRRGIEKTDWPGRLEIIKKDPLIVLDGAQNRASARALKETIKEYFRYSKLILVLGVSNDKDISGIKEELLGIADNVVLTEANLPRAMEVSVMENYFKSKSPILKKSVPDAIRYALSIAGREDLVLVTGSLFVVGEAKVFLNR